MPKFAAQRLIFFFETALLHGVANENDDALERKRLFDKIERTEFCRAHRGFDAAVAGNHDDRWRMRNGLHTAESFEAVHAGKPNVEEDDFEIAAGGAFQGFFGRLSAFDVIALIAKDRRERFADARFVVNDQDVRMRRHNYGTKGTASSGNVAKMRRFRSRL